MPKIKVGDVALVDNGPSPSVRIAVKDAIVDVVLCLTGSLVVSSALTLIEDDILNLVKRVVFLLGGKPLRTFGDNSRYGSAFRMLSLVHNRLWYGVLPDHSAPATGVATNAFRATVSVPFRLSDLLFRGVPKVGRNITAMLSGAQELEMVVDWGTTSDIFSAGAATFLDVKIEVIAVTDPSLNRLPRDARMLLREETQNLGVGAGANTAEVLDLNRRGQEPGMFVSVVDNSLRNDALVNRVQVKGNLSETLLDESWAALRAESRARSGLQVALPTGVAAAWFDEDGDLSGAVNLDDPAAVKSFQAILDRDAGTGTYKVQAHHVHLDPLDS